MTLWVKSAAMQRSGVLLLSDTGTGTGTACCCSCCAPK